MGSSRFLFADFGGEGALAFDTVSRTCTDLNPAAWRLYRDFARGATVDQAARSLARASGRPLEETLGQAEETLAILRELGMVNPVEE